jgi:hypothetical protein
MHVASLSSPLGSAPPRASCKNVTLWTLLQHVRALFVLIQDDVYALEFSIFNKISHCHRLHHSHFTYPLTSARSPIRRKSVHLNHLPNPAIYSTTPKLRSVASSGLDAWALHVGLRRGQSCSTDPRQVFATRQRNAKGSTFGAEGCDSRTRVACGVCSGRVGVLKLKCKCAVNAVAFCTKWTFWTR